MHPAGYEVLISLQRETYIPGSIMRL